MTILLIALLAVPFLWMTISPRSAWQVAFAWQYRDPERERPHAAPAVRWTGIIGLMTVSVILLVLIGQQIATSNRLSQCEAELVPAVSSLLQDRPDDLAAALTAVAESRGLTATTIAGVSTTFRDGTETVVIVQHNPESSSPVTCW